MSYSWGSDTSGSWGSGYSYSNARGAYNPRSYGGSSSRSSPRSHAGKPSMLNPKSKDISTQSESPLVVAIDVTGSMSGWPRTFFEKLPLLYAEVERYIPGTEICFAAIGDATCDRHPLQVNEFDKGSGLDAKIAAIYPEGGGGGQSMESYELAAQYFLTHCDMPNAKKPIFIFCGDEGFYDTIPAGRAKKVLGDDLEGSLDSMGVMKGLASKFDTYMLRKEYGGSEEARIDKQWREALGAERVYMLDDPNRIVDSIIGIVAGATGYFDDFTKRLGSRQTKAQVKQVMTSLRKGKSFKRSYGGLSVSKTKPRKPKRSKRLDDDT